MRVAGVDEVGMGSLAGPIIIVAAVYSDMSCPFPGLIDTRASSLYPYRDSKSLSILQREHLYPTLIDGALDVGVAQATHEEVTQYGIRTAHRRCLLQATQDLRSPPDIFYIDGADMRVAGLSAPARYENKMDVNHWQVAAASIIAKVWRDSLMREYHQQYPVYSFLNNAGYGTDAHCQALREYGPCPIHREEFIQRILKTGAAAPAKRRKQERKRRHL